MKGQQVSRRRYRSTNIRIMLVFGAIFVGLVSMKGVKVATSVEACSCPWSVHWTHRVHPAPVSSNPTQAPRRFIHHRGGLITAATVIPPSIHDTVDQRWLAAVLHPSAGSPHLSTRFWGWLPAPPTAAI